MLWDWEVKVTGVRDSEAARGGGPEAGEGAAGGQSQCL